jgi:signal transduction histidine kinase
MSHASAPQPRGRAGGAPPPPRPQHASDGVQPLQAIPLPDASEAAAIPAPGAAPTAAPATHEPGGVPPRPGTTPMSLLWRGTLSLIGLCALVAWAFFPDVVPSQLAVAVLAAAFTAAITTVLTDRREQSRRTAMIAREHELRLRERQLVHAQHALERERSRVALFQRAAEGLRGQREIGAIAVAGLELITTASAADCGAIYLRPDDRDDFQLAGVRGITPERVPSALSFVTHSAGREALGGLRPMATTHGPSGATHDLGHRIRVEGFIPIVRRGRAIGVVWTARTQGQPFSVPELATAGGIGDLVAAEITGASALARAIDAARISQILIEHAPDPVALFSASGKVLVENPPMALLRGKALPVDVPETMRQGELRDEIVADSGRRILTRYATPVTDGEGRAIGRLVALRDVTAERDADRLKDEFFALVSHELRTPLTSMLGYLDLVRDEELSEDATEFIDVIERNAMRLQRVVGDLLFVARFEAGHIPIMEGNIDLRPLCDEALAAALPAADGAGVQLQLDADRSAMLSADRDRIGQVVDNLVNNAIKFTPQGGEVTLRLRDRGDCVVVEVADSGEGIDPDEIDNIFKRFYRSGRVVRRAVPGAGLGLTIVRSIVEAHGGTIRVTSRLGRGSTFTVTLPRERDRAAIGVPIYDAATVVPPGV